MKKSALVLMVLFGVLFTMVLSCASTGGGGKSSAASLGTGYAVVGCWGTYDDHEEPNNGSSKAYLVGAEESIDGVTFTTYTITGNLTTQFVYGFAGWYVDPDTETFDRFKKATGFSFKVLGDGKRYSIKYKTTDCQIDYCYYQYDFDTVPGQAVTIEVPMKYFLQPSWGIWKKLNQDNVIGVEFQTHEKWRTSATTNPFEVKMWDFKVYN